MNKYSKLSNEELDRQIAERVMGWRPVTGREYDDYWEGYDCGEVADFFAIEAGDFLSGITDDPNDLKVWDVTGFRWSSDETKFFRDVVPRARELGFKQYECGVGDTGPYFAFYHLEFDAGYAENESRIARAGSEAALLALDAREEAK